MHRKQGLRAVRTNTDHASAVADPFGPDGFGDSWDKQTAAFESDSDEELLPLWQSRFTATDSDWAISAETARQRAAEEETKRQNEKELLRKTKDSIMRLKKKKIPFQAAAAAVAKAEAKKEATKARWDRKVSQAKEALALAKPAESLRIFYSLFCDESFHSIPMEEQHNIAQMAMALENHRELIASTRDQMFGGCLEGRRI